jgi:hypothetical protein
MAALFALLNGLPGTGPPSVSCPREWGQLGREGTVVSFQRRDGSTWVGNFQGGLGTETAVREHPDSKRVLVIANGALYEVDPERAEPIAESDCCVTEIWPIPSTNTILLARDHIALMLWTAHGRAWDTGRLSWDGFRNVRIAGDRVEGEAWSAPGDSWSPFRVDLRTGEFSGGAVELPDYGKP